MVYEKKLLNEGKTKRIFEIKDNPDFILVEYKNTITKNDNPDLTKEFEDKAKLSNIVNSEVFLLLKKAGIPVAFTEEISSIEFAAQKCEMIGLEVVIRRFAVGSYLKRNPNLEELEGIAPKRFHKLVVELFLKTTRGKLVNSSGKLLVDGLDPKKGEEDPFISNPGDAIWNLCHPKKPSWSSGVGLGSVQRADVIGDNSELVATAMMDLAKNVFLVLEGAWNTLGYRLIDMKIEFGYNQKGELVVADVIDNDSWRLRSFEWKELSKESFRQNETLSEVEKKYGIVASLVRQWRIPNQALVLWRESKEDSFPEIIKGLHHMPGLTIERVTLSGNKNTRQSLDKINDLIGKYPDGGVILVGVEMSNGLGPILTARSCWSVINIPATLKSFPEDVWASIGMPSNIPYATVSRDQNTTLLALNVLVMKNPLLYALRQKEIEKLDY